MFDPPKRVDRDLRSPERQLLRFAPNPEKADRFCHGKRLSIGRQGLPLRNKEGIQIKAPALLPR